VRTPGNLTLWLGGFGDMRKKIRFGIVRVALSALSTGYAATDPMADDSRLHLSEKKFFDRVFIYCFDLRASNDNISKLKANF